MKKSYMKPTLLADNFGMSENISSDCEGIANWSEFNCSVTIPDLGWVIYMSAENGCAKTGVGTDLICYHNPTDANNVFSS